MKVSKTPHPLLRPLIKRDKERKGETEYWRAGKVTMRVPEGRYGRRMAENTPIEPLLWKRDSHSSNFKRSKQILCQLHYSSLFKKKN